tara:strand:+ start:183 stop:1010 length:828 start_codon:yes stop_codon:yes gene_type:complete
MKVALCLHGYMSSFNGLDSFSFGYNYIYNKIIKNNNVDIFVHCWEIDQENYYNTHYGSKTTIKKFEKQKDFKVFDVCQNQKWFDEGFDRKSSGLANNTIERTLSFLYSRKQSINLKNSYEKDHDFKYDCTILSRFDLGNRGKEWPQKYYATNFNFLKDSDMTNLHCAYWDQFNHGLPDHWFYGNSSVMTKVSQIYDNVFDYYRPESDYVNSCLNGWIKSNAIEEFSNENFKHPNNRSSNLKQWQKWECIDNHKIYKWHIDKLDIPMRFVDVTKDL